MIAVTRRGYFILNHKQSRVCMHQHDILQQLDLKKITDGGLYSQCFSSDKNN